MNEVFGALLSGCGFVFSGFVVSGLVDGS